VSEWFPVAASVSEWFPVTASVSEWFPVAASVSEWFPVAASVSEWFPLPSHLLRIPHTDRRARPRPNLKSSEAQPQTIARIGTRFSVNKEPAV